MTPPLNLEQQAAFSEALVMEIKAEMGRRDLSSRALGALVGQSSQYMSMRLDGGNKKTGKRVELTVSDVAAIASVFGMEPYELLGRAQASLEGAQVFRPPFGAGRKRDEMAQVEQSAAWHEEDEDH